MKIATAGAAVRGLRQGLPEAGPAARRPKAIFAELVRLAGGDVPQAAPPKAAGRKAWSRLAQAV